MVQRFAIDALTATPWKNGGGTTREIVCQPPGAGMDCFDWRVSIATIDAAGPFSAFPGVDRVIMLLDGDGVHLRGDGVDHRLDTPLAPFPFAGDVALDCAPLDGMCTDFNVMTRRAKLRAEVQVLRAAGDIAPAESGLLLAQGGAWQISDGDSDSNGNSNSNSNSNSNGNSSNGQSLVCTAGTGAWWQGRAQSWCVVPQSPGAALVVLRLYPL